MAERVQMARKSHRCEVCRGEIVIGQTYTRIRRWGRPEIVLHRPESSCQPCNDHA